MMLFLWRPLICGSTFSLQCGFRHDCFFVQMFVSRLTAYFRRKCVSVTDERVQKMNEVLNYIKFIKMYAWVKAFSQNLQSKYSAHLRTLALCLIYNNSYHFQSSLHNLFFINACLLLKQWRVVLKEKSVGTPRKYTGHFSILGAAAAFLGLWYDQLACLSETMQNPWASCNVSRKMPLFTHRL